MSLDCAKRVILYKCRAGILEEVLEPGHAVIVPTIPFAASLLGYHSSITVAHLRTGYAEASTTMQL